MELNYSLISTLAGLKTEWFYSAEQAIWLPSLNHEFTARTTGLCNWFFILISIRQRTKSIYSELLFRHTFLKNQLM